MREKPDLPDENILACLGEQYGLVVTELTFLPLGFDAAVGVYRVQAADGQHYFLKARRGAVAEITLQLPRSLKDQGIGQVIAPLPTSDGKLWAQAEQFALVLYPFIEGKSGMETGLSDRQWAEFGAVLSRLHATRLPPALAAQVRVEDFVPNPSSAAVIRQLQATIHERTSAHPSEQALFDFWREKRAAIGQVLRRAEALGRQLREKAPEMVLCHADIHTANLLLTEAGQLFIVDWDQPIFAPRERDLMFVIDDVVGDSSTTAFFFNGYGETDLDVLALAYYRYEWAVQDIGAFAAQVLEEGGSDQSKQEGLHWFKVQFGPGNSVDNARVLDDLFFNG
jgi:spectinomycin phosphotransferase